MQKVLTFLFSKNIRVYAIFNHQSFNDTLTNGIVSFEHLGPGLTLFVYNSKGIVEQKVKESYLVLRACYVAHFGYNFT